MAQQLQNSLTSPNDRDKTKESTFKLGTQLTEQNVQDALAELNINNFVDKFPRVEKFYADPPIPNQQYALVSFLPSKGASPDTDGVFGILKVRGTFATEQESNIKAEYLIRNVDSYHSIYHTYVGRPFPLSKGKKYISETTEIDMKKKIVDTTSEEVRKKRDEEAKIMHEIEERQKELLADVDETKEDDPIELYTELSVKKAHLIFTFVETVKKLKEMKVNIKKTWETISKMDIDTPECRHKYMERYMDARKKSGLDSSDQSFIKYLGEDIDIDSITL